MKKMLCARLGIGLVKGEAILGVRTYEGVGVVFVMLCFANRAQDLQCQKLSQRQAVHALNKSPSQIEKKRTK
ncbi:hypothetical protein NC651_009663 [Populus alba x Populus x berolinensis]|nr:hypothetical protein NC651_009663 [Populus alba x Populus x berolinensis]